MIIPIYPYQAGYSRFFKAADNPFYNPKKHNKHTIGPRTQHRLKQKRKHKLK